VHKLVPTIAAVAGLSLMHALDSPGIAARPTGAFAAARDLAQTASGWPHAAAPSARAQRFPLRSEVPLVVVTADLERLVPAWLEDAIMPGLSAGFVRDDRGASRTDWGVRSDAKPSA
jgi:hypothetical protein